MYSMYVSTLPSQSSACIILPSHSLQDFFQAAESQGIKMSTIERGIKQLRGVIALYRETTGRHSNGPPKS